MRQIKSKKKFISLKVKLIFLMVVLAIVGIVVFFSSKTGQAVIGVVSDGYQTIVSKTHLRLRNVQIIGNRLTKKEDVAKVLNLKQGVPILDVDLVDIQMKVGDLPWVDGVVVQRFLPDMIRIEVLEKTPIAVWQNNKTYFPLDETGQPVNDNQTPLSGLILVVGRDAPEYTPELVSLLKKYPMIGNLVQSAVRVGDRRWNLILRDLNDGTTVYLPQKDIEGAFERLKIWHEQEQVLDKDFKVIDLRIEDRLIVRTDAKLIEEEETQK